MRKPHPTGLMEMAGGRIPLHYTCNTNTNEMENTYTNENTNDSTSNCVWDVQGSTKDRFILMLVERLQALERTVWQLEGSATDTFSATVQANGHGCKWNELVAIVACALNHPDIAEVRFRRAVRAHVNLPFLQSITAFLEEMLPMELSVVVRFRERLLFDAAAAKLVDCTAQFEGVASVMGEWRRRPVFSPDACKAEDGTFVYKPTRMAHKVGCTDIVATQPGGHAQNPLGVGGPWLF